MYKALIFIALIVSVSCGCPHAMKKRQARPPPGNGGPNGGSTNNQRPNVGPGSNNFDNNNNQPPPDSLRPRPDDGGKGDRRPRPTSPPPAPVTSNQCDANNRYPSADGSCNNLENPMLGAAISPFKRFLNSVYQDGSNAARTLSVTGAVLPNPRLVSRALMNDNTEFENVFSDLLVYFGQWLAHDFAEIIDTKVDDQFVFCPCEGTQDSNCLSYPLPPFDAKLTQSCFEFTRSQSASISNKREQTNHLSSFIDGSQVYGKDESFQHEIRSFVNGRLATSVENYLPRSETDFGCSANFDLQCFVGGEDRASENLALTSVHTLWMRSHNNLADGLRSRHRNWNDEQLYQEARKINLALMQHVIYNEWLPVIVGQDDALKPRTSGYFNGYDNKVDPSLANEFGVAAFRFGHTLIRNSLDRYNLNHQNINSVVELSSIIFDVTEATNTSGGLGGLEKIFMGLLEQPTSKFDSSVVDTLQNHLFEFNDGNGGIIALDLAATNINRGRDHGVPAYHRYRQMCGSPIINNWADYADVMTAENIARLTAVYASPRDVDLFVGGLHETPVSGNVVGPTFACIIKKQFEDLKKGDRFYYENGPSNTAFSQQQLDEIRKVTMSGLICETFGLNTIQSNAFKMPYAFIGNSRKSCNQIAKLDITKF